MPPAWYPDPAVPGLLRWWDGQAWTEHTQPAQLPPRPPAPTEQSTPFGQPSQFGGPFGQPGQPGQPSQFGGPFGQPGQPSQFGEPFGQPAQFGSTPYPPAGPSPVQDVAAEARSGRIARVAMYAGAAAYLVQYVVAALIVPDAIDVFREVFRAADRGESIDPANYDFDPGLRALSNAAELALLVVGILFMIWFYRAATVARRAGLPAARSPVWAVLGFIVPIVNFWYPYQVARDLFPPEHAGRKLAARWWTCYLSGTVLGTFAFVLAFASTLFSSILFVILAAVMMYAAALMRQLILEANRTHESLVLHR